MVEQEMQGGFDPVYHVNVNNQRGILDRGNPELMGGDDGLKILQHYSKVQNAPKEDQEFINKMYNYFRFGFFNQSLILTFYDVKDKPLFDIDFELNWLTFMMTLPPGTLSQRARLYKYQLKRYADNLFYRSVGTSKNNVNERISQQLSVFQSINTPLGKGGGDGKPGFMNKIKSLLG